jgi:hypothetical protein
MIGYYQKYIENLSKTFSIINMSHKNNIEHYNENNPNSKSLFLYNGFDNNDDKNQ